MLQRSLTLHHNTKVSLGSQYALRLRPRDEGLDGIECVFLAKVHGTSRMLNKEVASGDYLCIGFDPRYKEL